MGIIKLKNFKENDSIEVFNNWLQKDLNQVNKIILENLETDSSLITELSSYIIAAGGKRIRPFLIYKLGSFLNIKIYASF